mmetsp:Transcript_126100/g.306402  ORF Transcript_126100/g.306402 Transcript_126100/m.306402 type:complete len:409 (+) Transcript_126100:64-1290(+)
MLGSASLTLLSALAAGSLLPAAALRLGAGKAIDIEAYTFQHFVRDFQRTYEQGTEEWAKREELFNRRLAEASEFNALPGQTWKMGPSRFMDFTASERQRVLGYRGRGGRRAREASPAAASLRRAPALPSSFSVVEAMEAKQRKPRLLKIVRDQGNCGSCWATAATSTLEGQMEVNATLMDQLSALKDHDAKVPTTPTLSSQAVVSCTPNPRHCGGQGGCAGATVELAYGMLEEKGGLPFAMEWSYKGTDDACKTDLFSGHKIGITSFTTLPANKQQPLLEAIVTTGGPIAVSVDATNWFMYSTGIFSDGKKGDFTVNHAVTLMGYKKPDGGEMGWYDIKNSWGAYWGENGHIRIEMKPDDEQHCGWDYNTKDGLACDGDPDSAWVCGTCGVLYDSAFPMGLHLKKATA